MIKTRFATGGRQLLLNILLISGLWLIFAPPVAVVQANASSAAGCVITVPAGWQPYLVQAGDTLAALARQYQVTAEDLRAVNCLPTAELSTRTLLLVPKVAIPASLPPTPVALITSTTTVVLTSSQALSATAALPATAVQPAGGAPSRSGLNSQAGQPGATPGRSSWGFMVAALLVITLLIWYLGIFRPGPERPATHPGRGLLVGYTLFIALGFLSGLFVAPGLTALSLFQLPVSVGIFGTLALIPLLVMKEVAAPVIARWRLVGNLLNLVLAPLLALFLITVLGQFVEYLR